MDARAQLFSPRPRVRSHRHQTCPDTTVRLFTPTGNAGAKPDTEERFKATLEQAAVGVAHQTLDDKWVWMNQRWCEIVGFSRDELLQRNLSGLTHPSDRQASAEFDKKVRGGVLDRYSIEKRYIRKDGVVVWTQLTVSVARDAAGKPSYCIAFLDDITQRKSAEQRLAAQYSVARILGDSPDSADAPRRVIEAICREIGWNAGSMWLVDEAGQQLVCVESRRLSRSAEEFRGRAPDMPLKIGQGIPGKVWATGAPAWIQDVSNDSNFPRSLLATSIGMHGAFAFPVKSGPKVLGLWSFSARHSTSG